MKASLDTCFEIYVEEISLRKEGLVADLDGQLAKLFPTRTREAIRAHRKSVKYKEHVDRLSSDASRDTEECVVPVVTDPAPLAAVGGSGGVDEEQLCLGKIQECLLSMLGMIPSKNLGQHVLDNAISVLPTARLNLLDQHASQFLWELRESEA